MSQQVSPNYVDATIANGQSESAWIPLQGRQLVAIRFPAAMTGTTPTIRFRARVDAGSGDIVTQKNSTADYVVTFVASRWVPLDLDVFCGAAEVQIVASATQLADRSFRLITRPLL